MMSGYYTVVLSIAGSDSGGGAGIQGDLKTISALGCFATTAITAITVQNTMGVKQIHPVPADIVAAQIEAVICDLKPKAIKIGMVYNSQIALSICSVLKKYPHIPVVFDPVMVASTGDKLIGDDMVSIIKTLLMPITYLLTPNLDEASLLAGMVVENVHQMEIAAKKILKCGSYAVLLKGGHLKGKNLYDVYLDRTGRHHIFQSEIIQTSNTHGTGCCLSSAIASYLALGEPMLEAVRKARTYLRAAIFYGKDLSAGEGTGPLNHFFNS
jgi:hydroxymethylpyrimidine/phosphomethylpyrimidine kinase